MLSNSLRSGNICKSALLTIMLVVGLTGCAGKIKGPPEPVFFPPAPNPPRIQYLMGIDDSTDIEGVQSNFSFFVFGEQQSDKIKSIKKPYGITTSGSRILVTDIGAATIISIDPAAKTFEFLKGNHSTGKLRKPANMTVDSDGNLYVADVGRKEVVVYDAAGNFSNAFGGSDDMKPVDVAVDGDFLYALDISHNEIKVMERKSGKLLGTIGKGAGEEGVLSLPTNLTVDNAGYIYVTNAGSGKVVKMDRDNHVISTFGKLGDGFGQFGRPRGISVDREGLIYVADAAHQNVQIFDPGGRLLIFFGDPGLTVGSMNLPADVAVTTENLAFFQKLAAPGFILEKVILVTNQFGRDKIGIYGLGRMQGRDGAAGANSKKVETGQQQNTPEKPRTDEKK